MVHLVSFGSQLWLDFGEGFFDCTVEAFAVTMLFGVDRPAVVFRMVGRLLGAW